MSAGIARVEDEQDIHERFGVDLERKIKKWLRRCISGVRADKKREVYMDLVDILPEHREEAEMVDWTTYMPVEAVAIIAGNRASQRPAKSALRSSSFSARRKREAATNSSGGSFARSNTSTPPNRKTSQHDILRKIGSAAGLSRSQSTTPESRTIHVPYQNNNNTSVRHRRPSQRQQPPTSQRISVSIESSEIETKSGPTTPGSPVKLPRAGSGRTSSGRQRQPRGIVAVEGMARVGSVLFATVGTSAETPNSDFIVDQRAQVSWWVEVGDDLFEVAHLRDSREFPLTSSHLSCTIVCRYVLTGLLKGDPYSGDPVEAVTRRVQPAETPGGTPRMRIRNIAKGELRVGATLELPTLNNPITELPVWHFVMPKRKQGLSGDSTDYGISSASDSPDVSLHDTSYDESALPDPVRGDTVVLREEHTGFLVQLRLSMQGGRPLCSEVGIVESESSVRAASSKPKSKHATGNRARSGSASSRCSTARSRSEEGSDNNDGGPRVSLREPCRPPAKAPSNPTPRSTISDDIMDTMRSYDPEQSPPKPEDVPGLDMNRIEATQDRLRRRLETTLEEQAKKDKERLDEIERLKAQQQREEAARGARPLRRRRERGAGSPTGGPASPTVASPMSPLSPQSESPKTNKSEVSFKEIPYAEEDGLETTQKQANNPHQMDTLPPFCETDIITPEVLPVEDVEDKESKNTENKEDTVPQNRSSPQLSPKSKKVVIPPLAIKRRSEKTAPEAKQENPTVHSAKPEKGGACGGGCSIM